ncbi:MAG: phage virion morphogenesis protein [Proteobacteria bacterium]|nr:MAG: phage virion morphogenesis protein [Pseudomonadota bacterium]
MTGVTITLDDREAWAMLKRLQDRLDRTKPAFQVIGEIVRSSVERNFAAEGRPRKWDPSARAIAEGGQTLSDTGRLRRSLNTQTGEGYAAVGTNVIYAAIHHFGGEIRPKKAKALNTPYGLSRKATMPARPFLMVQDEDLDEINAAISDFLSG